MNERMLKQTHKLKEVEKDLEWHKVEVSKRRERKVMVNKFTQFNGESDADILLKSAMARVHKELEAKSIQCQELEDYNNELQ